MSHSSDKQSPKFSSYTGVIEDEEESATLAEPMTLEGAKQLAQSVRGVPTPPLVNHPLQAAASPTDISSPNTPSTLHHHLTSPLPPHHHASPQGIHPLSSPQGIHHPLSSPPSNLVNVHNHLNSPHHSLTSPQHHHSPSGHLPIHHPLWVAPHSVQQDDEEEEEEEDNLPSTVDIQALRDSPSPDPAGGKLVTINENWDSLEDNIESVADGNADDDSFDEEDEYSDSSDSDSKLSESELNNHNKTITSALPHNSPKSVSPSKECDSSSESDSDSCDSKSDSDSQDSDSDSSGCSSSDGDSNSSSLDEEDDVKALPRRKPQLTASNLRLSKPSGSNYKNVQGSVIAKGKLNDLKKCQISAESEEKVDNCKVNLDNSYQKLSFQHPENSYQKLSPLKREQNVLNAVETKKTIANPVLVAEQGNKHTNKKLGEDKQLFKENTLKGKLNYETKTNDESKQEINVNKVDKRKDIHCVESSKSPNKNNSSNSYVPKLKEEQQHLISDSKLVKTENHCESKLHSPISLSRHELEERRIEKKKEMDREFDRLLKSTTQMNLGNSSKSPQKESNLGNCNKSPQKESNLSNHKSSHKDSNLGLNHKTSNNDSNLRNHKSSHKDSNLRNHKSSHKDSNLRLNHKTSNKDSNLGNHKSSYKDSDLRFNHKTSNKDSNLGNHKLSHKDSNLGLNHKTCHKDSKINNPSFETLQKDSVLGGHKIHNSQHAIQETDKSNKKSKENLDDKYSAIHSKEKLKVIPKQSNMSNHEVSKAIHEVSKANQKVSKVNHEVSKANQKVSKANHEVSKANHKVSKSHHEIHKQSKKANYEIPKESKKTIYEISKLKNLEAYSSLSSSLDETSSISSDSEDKKKDFKQLNNSESHSVKCKHDYLFKDIKNSKTIINKKNHSENRRNNENKERSELKSDSKKKIYSSNDSKSKIYHSNESRDKIYIDSKHKLCNSNDSKHKVSHFNDSKHKYYASDSKHKYHPNDSKNKDCKINNASTSSSECEDTVPTYKRTPTLNVTAKVIKDNTSLKAKSQLKSKQNQTENNKNSTKLKDSPSKSKYSESPQKNNKFSLDGKSPQKEVQPTIADIVKVRERRKSLETDGSSSIEREPASIRTKGRKISEDDETTGSSSIEREPASIRTKGRKISEEDDETTSSSEASDELNEKVDVDTEQTQTFSVSESNFNQGRLTMRIAAMKMAKFGKTGLKEVTTGGLPTRSDLHSSPTINLSSSSFKRPRMVSSKGSTPSTGVSNTKQEPHKVKTAAERKTYVDALPPCGSMCTQSTGRGRKPKGVGPKGDMRVPASSLYRSGGTAIGGFSPHHHHIPCAISHQGGRHQPHTEADDEISRIAHTLSQISHNDQLASGLNDHLGSGLQVLDQEDLAAILPDVSGVGPQQDAASSGSLDPFRDYNGFVDNNNSETDDLSSNEATQDESLLNIVLSEENLNSVFDDNIDDELCNQNNSSQNRSSKSSSRNYRVKDEISSKIKDESSINNKRRKGRPPKNTDLSCSKDISNEEEPPMPELESYVPLDCNVSNVSPDSGIQSVNGSPLHPVGSPSHHHSPFYSTNMGATSGGSVSNSLNSTGELSTGENGLNGDSSSHGRSFSPTLGSQDSPPPPTLMPAITPPHLASSPHYNYDESGNSPQMPSLKCQIDPPPWEEGISEKKILEEQGSLNERGPGRPRKIIRDEEEKMKRPRGRPKGSKNKKRTDKFIFIHKERKPVKSFIREPTNTMAKLGKSNENGGESLFVPEVDYAAMKHKWRGASVDNDEFPSMDTPKRGRGRPPKHLSLKYNLIKRKSIGHHISKGETKVEKRDDSPVATMVKRPPGRPKGSRRKESFINDSSGTLPSKKCPSERILHKIINEKVRNSEKSDKLSVQHDLNDDVKIEEKKRVGRSKTKVSKESFTFTERKKKRGRKKKSLEQLPKIFEKVYGSSVKEEIAKSPNSNMVVNVANLSHKKKKKKHKKLFKSKHKNIVDPVFLAEVEELSAELQHCCISKNLPSYLCRTGEVPVPPVFRIHTVLFGAKKRRAEKSKASDKESGAEGDSSKEKISGKRKKKAQEVPKQGRDRSEANEQRLPLKKRHRHISTAVPTSPEGQKFESSNADTSCSKTSIDKPEKIEDQIKANTSKSSTVDNVKVIKSDHCKVSGKVVCEFKGKSEVQVNDSQANETLPAHSAAQSSSSGNTFSNSKVDVPFIEPANSETIMPEKETKINKQSGNEVETTYKPLECTASQTLATTPKKRHRLEAEINTSSISVVSTLQQPINDIPSEANVEEPTTIIKPLSSKIKQEKDKPKEKEVNIETPDNLSKNKISKSLENRLLGDTTSIVPEFNTSAEVSKTTEVCDEGLKTQVEEKEDNTTSASMTELVPETSEYKMSEEDKNEGGTHSDSDIPSEHEPLYESDQSGFMSDKEGVEETPKKKVQKKKRKKKELGSVKDSEIDKSKLVDDEKKDESMSKPKKRVKRRKANRTGFPTIRKKKKKPKLDDTEDDDKLEGKKNVERQDSKQVDNKEKINVIPEDEPESKRKKLDEDTQKELDNDDLPRPRGRPKKGRPKPLSQRVSSAAAISNNEKDKDESKVGYVELQNLKNVLEKVANGISGRVRSKRELSEESVRTNSSEQKRSRRLAEDEVEDSDSNVLSSECHMSSEPASSDESSRSLNSRKKVPRWKKKYLVAGLFSDYFKQDIIAPLRKNCEISVNKSKMFESEDRLHKLLPPPCYCKKWLRERQVDFTLPFDLWWLHTHNMLPGRDLVPSWNYKKVKSNVYFDVKPNNNFEVQACNCKRPKTSEEKGCGDDCINRMMYIECYSQTCPIADACTNQRIQRHQNLNNLQRFMTTDKGWGVKTTQNLKSGTFILEYVGEVVSEKEFKHRMQTKYANDKHHYCLNLDRGMVIDGHRIGGDCRFVNHSCEPNCEMQKWFVNGQYRMALFALQDIKKGEELTYDYNFSLFNPTEGQPCKCCSVNCRGVIGGRSQRVNGHSLEGRKRVSGRNKKDICKKRKRGPSSDTEPNCLHRSQLMAMKPLSHQQRLYILAHRCFLLRNLEKVRRSREKINRIPEIKKVEEETQPLLDEPDNKIEKFLTHFTALNTARSVKTRRLAQAEDDPHMTRVAKLAQIFKDIHDKLVASRDENDKPLATPFMTLPSKKRYPNYYSRVAEPIDLSVIEKNILTGHYISAETFDRDIMRLFANNLRFYGKNTETGQMAVGLRKVYSESKLQFKPFLEEVLGESELPPAFANCTLHEEFEDEDVIRCVCNLHRDEGMMIQCERCLVWQHCDCMGVSENDNPEHYLCEECSPRIVSPEVPMIPQPPDAPKDHKYFVTLLRDNLQIKQGDSVYILRDRPPQKPGERRQPAYKLAKDVRSHDLLIFKVENLWIDEKGDKYAFGHHYLRPHETFHEPRRKFFPNEVIRSPHFEIIPLDMIVNHCWVMDLNSYCRGRPIVAIEEHVYVCEYRVDKVAKIFSKISKPKYPICTKPYAFRVFPTRLKPQRTYSPHVVHWPNKGSKARSSSNSNSRSSTPNSSNVVIKEEPQPITKEETETPIVPILPPPIITPPEVTEKTVIIEPRKSRSATRTKEKQSSSSNSSSPPLSSYVSSAKYNKANLQSLISLREKRRERVNGVATKLLYLLPAKGAVDMSFLLENGKRQRKKTTAFAS